ncbi:TetR family transcriptional regulator [Nocardiopsis sp. HNM0947]|uniref:TetR family transcriptional regulator n=1 Tax=Nocardiopsis coralli TaxID=2772213 RepID=A0ABR9P3D3_9ACTN|nr:TetR family transcriptional regulator [Nocardiopsis coralli]MBE2998361.1 TetR family transcriptional regulator [Nocardiopsis coralli]
MTDPDRIQDGRRRKGEHRRRLLVEATMRVIERDGAGSVSQRRVAAEAGVPPSAVTYYFAAVDDLLVATLTSVNDLYVERIDALGTGDEGLAALARLIAPTTEEARAHLVAECELFLMAARRPAMRPEIQRWTATLDAFLAPYAADPVQRTGVATAIEGMFLRGAYSDANAPGPDEVHRILRGLLGR